MFIDIKFNEKAWLKPYIDMNTKVRKRAKKWLWERLFKMMNSVSWKNHGKCEKTNIKLVTTERRRNYFVSEPNYHTSKNFIENLLAIEFLTNK